MIFPSVFRGLCVLSLAGALCAADKPASSPEKTAEPAVDKSADAAKDKKPKDDTGEKTVVTTNSVVIGGQKIEYTAKAGVIALRDREEKPVAEMFYIAYTRDGATNLAKRPVTFSFNGGPGSSSVWMHMGLLGPRRVVLEEDGRAVPPPYKLIDNEWSLLDESDLVFIDPIGTGYSHTIKPDDARKYFGVAEDTASVAEFIRLYCSRNLRWQSPKFIIGESYGTTRAAALSGELSRRQKMNVNGIILVSTVLNFQTLSLSRGNDLPNVLYLPSYTATAWYHKKLPADLQQKPLAEVLAEVEKFAGGDYNAALLAGAGMSAEERRNVVARLARFTGLPADVVDRLDLRIPLGRFSVELLRAEDKVSGRFDSRYTGFVRDRAAGAAPYDPSAEEVFSVFASTFNTYIRTELKYESDRNYEILAGVGPWNWDADNSFLNVAETLADSMTRNPFLKVAVACGYYDLATPYFAARYTFNHLGLAPAVAKNLTVDYYTAGHMMYLNLPDLKKQKADLARFLKSASGN